MLNDRTSSSMASQARVYRGENAIDSNEQAMKLSKRSTDYQRRPFEDPFAGERAVSKGKLDFLKWGNYQTGLDTNKMERYDGQMYDSSTPAFAKIRAYKQQQKMSEASGLVAPPPPQVNKYDDSSKEQFDRLAAWGEDTKYRHTASLSGQSIPEQDANTVDPLNLSIANKKMMAASGFDRFQ